MRSQTELRGLLETAAKSRAARIGAAAWYECTDEVLTEDEQVAVMAVWDGIPSGSSSWMTAFFKWFNELPEE